MRMTKELKTGLVVVAAAVLFGGMLLAVSVFQVLEPTYHVNVRFRFTGGLERHAPVRLAGVLVGEVDDIRLDGDEAQTGALVALRLKRQAQVRRDARIKVSTLGLLGEKYVEMVQGNAETPWAQPDETLTGEDPLQIDELVEAGQSIATELTLTLADVRELARHVDDVVEGNRADIDETLENARLTSINFREFSDDIKIHPWKLLFRGKEQVRAKK